MSSLEVCRVCLAGHIKIDCILNSRLQDVFERLTNSKLIEDGKPEKVCYVCYWQLLKCAIFCDKTQKSGDVLAEILQDNIEITPDIVAALTKGMHSSFSITRESASYNPNGALEEASESDYSDDETELQMDYRIQGIKAEDYLASPATLLCRVCLSADLKTCCIKNTSLQAVYEKLTRNKMNSGDGLPESICYICTSQLQVARKIIKNARKTENILTELFYNGLQLSQSIVSVFNLRTTPNLMRSSSVQCLSYCPHEDMVTVKDEVEKEETDFDALLEDAGSNINTIENEATLGQQIKLEVEFFEEEDSYNHINNKKTIISDINEYGTCDKCDYKCNSDIRLQKHLKMHDPLRNFPCKYCSLRYLSNNHLMLHENRVHQRIFKCRKCKIIFWNSVKYQNHVISHTTKDLYSCENCPKVFDRLKKLRAHCYTVHRRLRYPCNRCKYTSTSYEWLQDHIIRIHAKSPYYICDFCHKKFISKATLRNHLPSHYGTQRHQCDICPKTFSRKQILRSHLKLHTEKLLKCESCEKSFTEMSLLRKHALTHSTCRNFVCNICQKGFFKPEILKNHMQTHTAQKIYECDLCDKKFINNAYVKKHMVSHSNVKNHTCAICEKDFKTTQSLNVHIKSIHEIMEKPFKCDYCSKAFTRKQYLECHMELHLRRKPFPCDFCDKKFRSKLILVLHIRTHTGEKPYECNECGGTFAQRAALKRHIRAHNKDRPFKCDTCKKSFAEKISLTTHKLTRHDKIEKLICNLCCKVFIDKEKLTNHIQSHKEKPFLCVKCKKSYFKLSNLTQHVKIHPVEFHCAFCDEEFDTKTTLQRHNVRLHKALCRYACNVCELPFEALVGLNAHLRKHSGEKQFACEICFKTYVERRDFIHHMKVVHNKLEWFN